MSRDRPPRDHYDRPSWSEIDKKREKSSPAGPRAPSSFKEKEPDRYQQKKMDQAFSSLFTDHEKDAAWARVQNTLGGVEFVEALDAYREKWGLPTDFSVLAAILEQYPDGELHVEALQQMDQLLDQQAESTKLMFRSRVRLLRMTSKNAALKKAAGGIARRRGY